VKLGAVLTHDDLGLDPTAIKDVVQELEGVGFDSFHTNDHVIGGHPERVPIGERLHTYDVAVHEPFVLLGFLAAVTTRIELVTSVLILPQRQTVLVAKQAAEVDLLSGGRLRLGLGIGRNWMEYEAPNEDFNNRGARYEEQITVLRAFWSNELVTFTGTWHTLDRVGINPMPVQRPIPLWMGTFAGRVVERALQRAATLADGWMPQFGPDDAFAAALDRFWGYVDAAGRSREDIGIECVTKIGPHDDKREWVSTAKAYQSLGATSLKATTTNAGFANLAEHVRALSAWQNFVSEETGS
jgi:probable F420-dependent oxidoreductase